MTILGESVKRITYIILFLTTCIANADDVEPPWTFGGLDWSSDGRYIAVGTSRGAHIHNSDDLSLFAVLGDGYVDSVAWSNKGLTLAFNDDAQGHIVLNDIAAGGKAHLLYPTMLSKQEEFRAKSIVWGPGDSRLAAGCWCGAIGIWKVGEQDSGKLINVWPLYSTDTTQIDWRPGSVDIMSGSIVNGIAIWNYYMGNLMDFMWNTEGSNSPARWSPDGNMIAAGDNPINVWKVKPDRPHTAWDEIGGEIVYRLDYKLGRFRGLSWHPDSTKLAFVFSDGKSVYQPEQDASRDGALIWDLSSDSTMLLPGVFIVDMTQTDNVIEWSPGGNRLAALSSDGRIVIWDTSSHKIVAEYDGYHSILDFYKDNP